jgi:hypothetical protein
MQHIFKVEHNYEHDISDEAANECQCNPIVHIDKDSGNMFCIHNSSNSITSKEEYLGLIELMNEQKDDNLLEY